MVESKAVEYGMKTLGKAMLNYKAHPDNEQEKKDFHGAIYDVAHAIRDSISANWHTKL